MSKIDEQKIEAGARALAKHRGYTDQTARNYRSELLAEARAVLEAANGG